MLQISHQAWLQLLPRHGYQNSYFLTFSSSFTCSFATYSMKELGSLLFVKLFLFLICLCSFFLFKSMVTCISLIIFGATVELNWAVWNRNAISAKAGTFRYFYSCHGETAVVLHMADSNHLLIMHLSNRFSLVMTFLLFSSRCKEFGWNAYEVRTDWILWVFLNWKMSVNYSIIFKNCYSNKWRSKLFISKPFSKTHHLSVC